ncbi:MAG: amidohydrolase family protein [Deltaproteobacteria bacterium]|nr:amidohydrolase family protein [Deltaproteobacteria bacterium]
MHAYRDGGMRASVAAQYSDLDFYESLPMELAGAYERTPVPQPTVPQVIARVEPFLSRWKNDARLRPLLGPSSLPRCSVDLFKASLESARRNGVGLHTHLLSAKSQVPVARARYGGSTVEYLRAAGGLERWVSFAHAIWLDQSEIDLLAKHEAMVVHNPMSNLKLGAGVAPVPALLRAGVPVALGTDGASSNDSQNMFETLKGAALIQRVMVPHAEWPTAMQTLRMCWEGGARVLDAKVGRLAEGFRADLALLRLGDLRSGPKDQIAQQLVYGELGASVDSVVVDGAVVYEGGRVLGVDAKAIRGEAQALVDRIWATLPDREARFGQARPPLERLERAVRDLAIGFSRFG